MTLVEAITLMPPNFHLTCQVDLNIGTKEPFLSSVLYEDAPDGGWISGNPATKFEPRLVAGVTTSPNNLEAFERLTIGMIEQRFTHVDECQIQIGAKTP